MPAEDALDVGVAREYFSEAFGVSECHLIENVDADSMGWMMQGHHRRRGVARKLGIEPGELAGTELSAGLPGGAAVESDEADGAGVVDEIERAVGGVS